MTEPFLSIVLLAPVGLASLGLWGLIAWRWSRGDDILPYEPRRRVPWSAGVGLIAVAVTAVNLIGTLAPPSDAAGVGDTAPAPEGFAATASADGVLQVMLVIVGCQLLRAGVGATWCDLGLPADFGQFWRDCRLGLLTAVTAMAPVYALHLVLVVLLHWEGQHPTLMQLAKAQDLATIAAAFFIAAVAAPLFEEFLFRLLLQGWLERSEDNLLGWGVTQEDPRFEEAGEEPAPERVEPPPADDDNPYASPQSAPSRLAAPRSLTEADHAARGELVSAGRLPHGWTPILVSSLVFAVAHLAQGPAPAPLFLFAVLLGYVYQRTHRITPCLVAHLVFNTFSLAVTLLAVNASDV